MSGGRATHNEDMKNTESTNDTDLPDDLIDTPTAAMIARKTPAAIRRWIATGKIRAWRFGDRWMVSRADVDACCGVAFVAPTGRPLSKGERAKREREVDEGLRSVGVRK